MTTFRVWAPRVERVEVDLGGRLVVLRDAGRGWFEAEVAEAGPGDFLHVPRGAIHREGNPGDEESRLVVVRAGHGPAVVNVDAPA